MAGVLVFEETLGTASLAWVPTELGPSAIVLGLLAHNQSIPSLVDQRLVKETIHNARMHPVTLCHTRLEVSSNVFDVALAGRVKGRAEAARPVLALSEELDHLFSVRASLASVALLVMLVERVGSPEAAVTSRLGTRILAPALVKLILVALPVVLALEAGLTRGAPINVGLTSCADRGTHRTESVQGAGRGNRKRRLRSVASRSGLPRHRGLSRVGRPDGSMSRRTGARRGNGDARAMAKRSLRGKKHGWVWKVHVLRNDFVLNLS